VGEVNIGWGFDAGDEMAGERKSRATALKECEVNFVRF
jgi:hypothetical protein